MSSDFCRTIVKDFLKNSMQCVVVMVKKLSKFNEGVDKYTPFFYIKNGKKRETVIDRKHFFIRTSVEYSNPQLTVEEVQGIVTARLLEVCGNYFEIYGLHEVHKKDVDEICEELKKTSSGKAISFLLNTDDVEPDRYSMNPLKKSIVDSGQSAFPSASVKTDKLRIDHKFIQKYEGALISKEEVELIERCLTFSNNSYMDMVDSVKYEQLENLSKSVGMNLCLPTMRMPITVLKNEKKDGLLHNIIKESHRNYESVKQIYMCMGRSMKNRTTLLTIPHSEKGYGSKRSARGKIYFESGKLKSIKTIYRTTPLYPNSIDPDDVSIAEANDKFLVDGNKLRSYDFNETPSSPQFILYSLRSPENAVLWHGIGAFGASELVRSYTSLHLASAENLIFKNINRTFCLNIKPPSQFNLIPKEMWVHPVYNNIDTSIGCIEDLKDLTKRGMKTEYLSTTEYSRK